MLRLLLDAPPEAFISEGAMPVTLRLSNDGGEPRPVPPPRGPASFEYHIYSGDTWIATASLRLMLIARGLARTTIATPAPRALPPGAAQDYAENLARLLTSPLPPGRYELDASYLPSFDSEPILSNRVPFEVGVPQPLAILQTLDGPFVAGFDFLTRNGSRLVLRQRDSLLSPGSFNDIHELPASGRLGDVSLAIPLQPGQPLYWRWLAWLDGRSLHAGVAQNTVLTYSTGPVPTPLESPSLLPFGYGFPDGRGLFLISGLEGAQPRIQLLTLLPERNRPPLFTTVPLSDLTMAPIAATVNMADDGSPEVILFWIVRAGARCGVIHSVLDAQSGEVRAAPRSIFATHREIAAHSFVPLHRVGEAGFHQFLLAPEIPQGRYTHLRLGVADASRRDELDLPSTAQFEGRDIDRWALPSPASDPPVAAAVTGGTIWVTHAGDWRRLDASTVLAASVRLWTVADGQVWCTWFDTAQGYRRSRIA